MAERSTFDPFERRFAAELERYVAPARDRRSTTEVAEVAMRPRGLSGGARNGSRAQRFLLLGLAAAFLVPAAYVGMIAMQPTERRAIDQRLPTPTDDPRATTPPDPAPPSESVSIFVRRDEGPEPGLSIFGVRPDGSEALVRKLPDSIAPGGGTWSEWGSVSNSGWLATGVEVQGGPWPLVLVNLGDEESRPWVIEEANLGGIGPSWGPTGLVAAFARPGSLVIADPESHETRTVSMQGRSLVGGGPSILWSADGTGIVGSTEGERYEIVPLDGGDPVPAVTDVFDPRGTYGPRMAELMVCSPGEGCPGRDDGRVERVAPDGPDRPIWVQEGDDRALAASFGDEADEFWLSLDHDKGRQIELIRVKGVKGERRDVIATLNRAADWQYVGAPLEAPDGSTLRLWLDLGGKPAAVLVPLTGAMPSFHTGHLAGFVAGAESAAFAAAEYGPPAETMPPTGEVYDLPPLKELIDAEQRLNPGRRVLGKASRDGVDGDTETRTFEVNRDKAGAGDAYLDCLGPSSVTVTSGGSSMTSPCLRAGSYVTGIERRGPVIVTASGDTSWRVVIYSN